MNVEIAVDLVRAVQNMGLSLVQWVTIVACAWFMVAVAVGLAIGGTVRRADEHTQRANKRLHQAD